jgi:hypothetical protein
MVSAPTVPLMQNGCCAMRVTKSCGVWARSPFSSIKSSSGHLAGVRRNEGLEHVGPRHGRAGRHGWLLISARVGIGF